MVRFELTHPAVLGGNASPARVSTTRGRGRPESGTVAAGA